LGDAKQRSNPKMELSAKNITRNCKQYFFEKTKQKKPSFFFLFSFVHASAFFCNSRSLRERGTATATAATATTATATAATATAAVCATCIVVYICCRFFLPLLAFPSSVSSSSVSSSSVFPLSSTFFVVCRL